MSAPSRLQTTDLCSSASTVFSAPEKALANEDLSLESITININSLILVLFELLGKEIQEPRGHVAGSDVISLSSSSTRLSKKHSESHRFDF